MEQSDLTEMVCRTLDRLGLPYFLTGSIASSYFGEPRFTNDIDVVVSVPESRILDLARAFPASDYYVSEEAARQAARSCGQFNIIHPESGLKIAVIVAADTPFNRSRFSRASRHLLDDKYQAALASIEDVILKKMQYYQEGGSEKHLRDITGMLRLNPIGVDYNYIASWAAEMGTTDIWDAVVNRLKT